METEKKIDFFEDKRLLFTVIYAMAKKIFIWS